MPVSFWERFNREPGVEPLLRLGELLDGSPSAIAQTWRRGAFTTMFDFPLGFAIADVFCRGQSPAKLATVLTDDRRYPDPAALVTLADNHDLPRLLSQCGHDLGKGSEALTFLLTARGIPSLTWGTEVGLDGEKEPDNRPSMRFEPHPFRQLISTWLSARKERPSLKAGVSRVLLVDDRHLAVARLTGQEATVIYVNHGSGPMTPVLLDGATRPDVTPVPLGVTVRTSRGDFEALTAQALRQLGPDPVLRRVVLDGEGFVVGSGAELGDWKPEQALHLPAALSLPVGGVFELKRLTRDATGTHWDPGPNRLLVVSEGLEPLHLRLAPP